VYAKFGHQLIKLELVQLVHSAEIATALITVFADVLRSTAFLTWWYAPGPDLPFVLTGDSTSANMARL